MECDQELLQTGTAAPQNAPLREHSGAHRCLQGRKPGTILLPPRSRFLSRSTLTRGESSERSNARVLVRDALTRAHFARAV